MASYFFVAAGYNLPDANDVDKLSVALLVVDHTAILGQQRCLRLTVNDSRSVFKRIS